MLTLERAAWQTKVRNAEFHGLSTDDKPTEYVDGVPVDNGSEFYEIDTGATYVFNKTASTWLLKSSGGRGASSWEDLEGKPFETIGEGLEVGEDGTLNVESEVVDVGSYQYLYDNYSLPAISVENLRTIYANHKTTTPQVIKWTLLGSETYFSVISADYIVDTYSVDILVHNKYHCQYNWTDSSTGNINPEVMKEEIETFIFKGYVSTTAPSGTLKQNELWYQSSTMPTTFPVQVKRYDGAAWGTETESYTPSALDMWADLANDHGYYWFGNDWNIIDVNVAYDDVTIGVNGQGQLQIKASAADNDKFMRCVNGQAAWVTVPTWNGGSY